jgi:hypothetical protein
MKHISLISTALTLALLNSNVQANENSSELLNNFSISAGVGTAQHIMDSSGGYEDESANASAFSLALNYEFTPNITASVGYLNYGEADLFSGVVNIDTIVGNVSVDQTITSETTGLALYGTYHTPRDAGGWSFGGSLGLISWATEISSKYSIPQLDHSGMDKIADENGIALIGGLDATYSFTNNFDMSLQATWFVNDLDTDLVEGETIDMQHAMYSLVATYRF